MQVTSKREEFLSNAKNKQHFINLLSDALRRANCQVKQAAGDADVTIVRAAVDSGQSTPTVFVGDGTDLLVLLCYHMDIHGCDVFFRPEPKTNLTRRRVWNIKKVKQQLGPEVCENLLFIHAFLGCDTTSRILGLGKGAALKKFISSAYFREQAKVFSHDSSTQDEILLAGENSLVSSCGERPGQKLDILRYQKYCEKVASRSTRIQPQSLPPTSCVAGFHSLRVRPQVQQWNRLGQIPRKPAILYFCRQTRGKVGKHALLDENYALNTKKLFTRPDFEFLTVKLQLKITDPNTGHENEAKLFSFVEVSFESKYLSKSAYYK